MALLINPLSNVITHQPHGHWDSSSHHGEDDRLPRSVDLGVSGDKSNQDYKRHKESVAPASRDDGRLGPTVRGKAGFLMGSQHHHEAPKAFAKHPCVS